VLTPDLTVAAVTDSYLQTTYMRREDVVGRDLFSIFPADPEGTSELRISQLRASLQTVLRTRRPHGVGIQRYDIPLPPEQGGGFDVRHWAMLDIPVLDDQGRVAWIIHYVEDVTCAVQRRSESETLLRIATMTADLGSWDYDPATDLFLRTPVVDEIYGFAPGEAGSNAAPFFERIHPSDLPSVVAEIDSILAKPEHTVGRVDYRVVRPDGSVRWVICRGETIQGYPGAEPHMIGVMMDVTEDRHREESLAAALNDRDILLRQKDMLLKEVNHRVKNSLQLVASLLRLQASATSERLLYAQFNAAAARVLAIGAVHEQLYKVGDFQMVSIDSYIRDLCAKLAESAGDGREWAVHVDAEPVEIATDRAVPLALIINELVTNAFKHAYPGQVGGTIWVVLTCGVDGFLSLTVADAGAGPPTENEGPKGLGSRLVRTLARQLGATVATERLDPGYKVTITLPDERICEK
jgi:PAS domain S-box-containing protein